MTASLKPRKPSSQAASPRQFSVAPSVKVMEGSLAGRFPSGTNAGCVAEIGADATLVCEGIFRHTVDNTALAAPGPDVYVDDDLIWPLFSTGLDASVEGQPAYGVDNQTFSTTSNNGAYPPIGEIWEVSSATSAFVRVGKRAVAAVAGAASLEWVTGTALTDTGATTIQRQGRRTSYLLAGTMSQDETITVGTTGALSGDVIRVLRTSTSAHTATFTNGGAGGGNPFVMPNSKVNFVELRFNGTNWLYFGGGTQ